MSSDWSILSMNTKLLKSDIVQDSSGRSQKHVIIVGGGIAGLSAAWYLQQKAAEQGLNLQYTVLEQSNRWGGKIQSGESHCNATTPRYAGR
jgi:monoamine oxidase